MMMMEGNHAKINSNEFNILEFFTFYISYLPLSQNFTFQTAWIFQLIKHENQSKFPRNKREMERMREGKKSKTSKSFAGILRSGGTFFFCANEELLSRDDLGGNEHTSNKKQKKTAKRKKKLLREVI